MSIRGVILLITFITSIFPQHISAQQITLSDAISRIVSQAGEEASQENLSLLIEQLAEMAENPVPLNSAERHQMELLFFLSDSQIESLMNYIARTGAILSLYEISLIPGFSNELAILMSPFITLGTTHITITGPGRIYHRAITTSSLRISDGTIDPSDYPLKQNLRYTLRSGSLTGSLIFAKDQGEPSLPVSGRPDFIAGGLSFRNMGRVKSVIIGDYTARFGLGVTVNTGYKPFITLTGTSFTGQREGFTLYSSVNENNYLRGAAATISLSALDLSLFVSSRYRDARIREDTSGVPYAVILSTAPYHSTLSAMEAKQRLGEFSSGFSLSLGKGNFRGGFTALQTTFGYEVRPDRETPATQYLLSGKQHYNAGIHYRMVRGRTTAAGELAISGNKALATAHTLNIRCDDRFTINLIYRNYARDYQSHLSGAPSRGSHTTNEEGVMVRAVYEAARGLFLYGGVDMWRSPWLRRTTAFPADGITQELKIRYNYSRLLYAEGSLRTATSTTNNNSFPGVPGRGSAGHQTVRLTAAATPLSYLTFTTNIMLKEEQEGNSGSMLAVDVEFSIPDKPVTIWFRHAVFHTAGFSSGLYLYERDMLYGFSIPVHYGTGSRTVLVISLPAGSRGDIRLKYGLTDRTREGIAVKLEDIKLQIRVSI